MDKSITRKEYRFLIQVLKTARKSRGITQTEMATKLGETQSFISDCERGQRRLDVIEVWQWCRAIGLSFAEFAAAFEKKVSETSPTARKPPKE